MQKFSTPESKAQWLTEIRRDNDVRCRRCARLENIWSWVRLLFFLAGIAAVYGFWAKTFAAVGTGVFSLALFSLAVYVHQRLKGQRKILEWMIRVIDESLQRCGGQVVLTRGWEKLAADSSLLLAPVLDPGRTWSLTEQEHDDLDLYAPPVGIFGLLNRTSTPIGNRRLQDWMNHSLLSSAAILARQNAVHRLDEHPIERLRIMGMIAPLRNSTPWLQQLIAAVGQATAFPRPVLSRVFRIWSWFTILFTLFAIGNFLIGEYKYTLGVLWLLVFNGILFLFVRRPLLSTLSSWQNLGPTLKHVLASVRQASADLPTDPQLDTLREIFRTALAHKTLPSLTRLQPWTEVGGPIHALLNCLFFYDLHVAEALLTRVLPHRDRLLDCFSALADLEAFCSLASFAWEQPVVCYPTPLIDPGLTLVAGRHPLISPERVVSNDVRVEPAKRLWIITGPNAAGKSTLLRTVGINLLLAQMGSAVTAQTMSWSPVRLMADLRVRDDLAIQESLFMSEVRHLRRMIGSQPDNVPLLGLIDEPFRGTNSREKLAASLALAEYLTTMPHFFFLATHEHALTRLPENTAAVNYHFQETLTPSGLQFDYRLRPGPAQTTTALEIMKQEGFPPDLLARAHHWLDHLPY
jgi:hypothetical protein